MLIDTKTPATAPPAATSDIPLALDAATARGNYCNVAIVARTAFEVVIDFAFVGPSQKNGVVVSRIIMNPTQAAALHHTLGENLKPPEASPV